MSGDNLTHHLVPRSGVMKCAYCGLKNADVHETCPERER